MVDSINLFWERIILRLAIENNHWMCSSLRHAYGVFYLFVSIVASRRDAVYWRLSIMALRLRLVPCY